VTRFITLPEVLALHQRVIGAAGGSADLRDLDGLESAVAQPRATYDDQELHQSLASKAAALGFSLISNHPFMDGNKRVGHAAIETFLMLNGQELSASVDESETMIIAVASGEATREKLAAWLEAHMLPFAG
jgi:death-on-curing protein